MRCSFGLDKNHLSTSFHINPYFMFPLWTGSSLKEVGLIKGNMPCRLNPLWTRNRYDYMKYLIILLLLSFLVVYTQHAITNTMYFCLSHHLSSLVALTHSHNTHCMCGKSCSQATEPSVIDFLNGTCSSTKVNKNTSKMLLISFLQTLILRGVQQNAIRLLNYSLILTAAIRGHPSVQCNASIVL